jgi:hypothetical protein
MAMRLIFILILAFSPCHLSGQSLTLALFDVAWAGDSVLISNQDIVSGSQVAEDHPLFHPTVPVLYYISRSANTSEIRSYNHSTRHDSTIRTHPNTASRLHITPDSGLLTFLSPDKGEMIVHPLKTGVSPRKPIAGLSVENYCWIDDNSMLVIQSGDPNTLNLVTLRPRKIQPVVKHVGQMIQRTSHILAFVHKLSVDSWSIKKLTSDGKISILSETFPGAEIFAVTADEKVMMAFEDKLYWLTGSGDWKEIKSFPHSEIKSIGLNATGDKLFVLFALK